MQQLKEQISRNLIVYQKEVDLKLRGLYNQGLLSKSDIEEFKIDVELTGKAVLQTFESGTNYPESVLKVYVDNLFIKYRSEVEAKIAAIERKGLKTHEYEKEIDGKEEKKTNKNRQSNFLSQLMNWFAAIRKQKD